MFDSFFDLPVWIAGPGIILALMIFAVAGLMAVRRWVLPRLRLRAEDSEFSGTMVQSVMVFYGLAVALIAVSVWQTYSDVSKSVSLEASELDAFYHDVSSYPEPIRSQLQKLVTEHVLAIIHEDWPLQRKGRIPNGGDVRINRIQVLLTSFEPVTENQKIMHAEALRAYNEMIEARELRIDAGESKVPGIMWGVITMGAVISLSSSFFFKIEDARLQGIQVVLLAAFIGLVIFMIFALDRPFRGDLGLGPEPYQLIHHDQLMKR